MGEVGEGVTAACRTKILYGSIAGNMDLNQ